jgi:hypothetical protein
MDEKGNAKKSTLNPVGSETKNADTGNQLLSLERRTPKY